MLALAIAGVGFVATSHSFAQMLRGQSLELALATAGWDGRITARAAEARASDDISHGRRVSSIALARRALLQDPTSVPAIAVVAASSQLEGDNNRARQLFDYSDRVSRRHLGTRLWLIEDAVGRNDIPAALRNYDIALRTSRVAPDILFPILASAISHDQVRSELGRTLMARPSWGERFIRFAVGNGDPEQSALLLRELMRRKGDVPADTHVAMIDALTERRLVNDAWAYYVALRPGADRARSRDARFKIMRDAATVFDWRPIEESGTTTTIQEGLFDFSAPMNYGGIVLRQWQMLPRGEYRLEGQSANLQLDGRSKPYWALVCSDGRELGRVEVPNSAEANGRFVGRFFVPAGCPVQYLSMVVRPSDDPAASSGQILEVSLSPASG